MPPRNRDDDIFRRIDRRDTALGGRIGKDFDTWAGVFDKPTVMNLHRMLRSKVLASIDFPVSTGKEADVFKATDGDGQDVALKVYRVSTPTFQKVLQYIEGDPRFRRVPREHRALVHAWARKEYRNLERFREAGVDVPIPYRCSENVVAMEYLAREDGPARTMKEEAPPDPTWAFGKLWDDYRRMIERAKSVHADFSEYNALMIEGAPRVIDCGQAVLTSHPMAGEFLTRDIKNLARYFRGLDVELDEKEMLAEGEQLLRSNPPGKVVAEETIA